MFFTINKKHGLFSHLNMVHFSRKKKILPKKNYQGIGNKNYNKRITLCNTLCNKYIYRLLG